MNDYYLTPQDYDKAAENGISHDLLYRRHYLEGWTKERAINQPKMKMSPKKNLKEWRYIAEQNGIKYMTFANRVNVWGWDMERAATQPLQDKRGHIQKLNEMVRKYPREITELADRNGLLKTRTFYNRIKRGWTPEQAASTPVMSATEKGRKGGVACAGKRKRPANCLTSNGPKGICQNILTTL